MFVRFERRRTGEGLFCNILANLRHDDRRIRRRDRPDFRFLVSWLWNNTPAPPDYVYMRPPDRLEPLTFWRDPAAEHIRVSWRICRILNLNGIPLRPIRSARAPGPVLYEDAVQAVILCGRWYRERIARYPQPRQPALGWSGDRATIRRWKPQESDAQ